jgi:hypothetical protein
MATSNTTSPAANSTSPTASSSQQPRRLGSLRRIPYTAAPAATIDRLS